MKYSKFDINRFVEAQEFPYSGYEVALKEIECGAKTSHWIWYIFPQFRDFAHSSTADYYGLTDKDEAQQYLDHPLLGPRLKEISKALLKHQDKTAVEILGNIDAGKVRSCMTTFDYLSPNDIFGEVLDAVYDGVRGGRTLKMLKRE
jgi:uncharacterized protein (DUF1810 family)